MDKSMYYYKVYDYIIETNYCCQYMNKADVHDFAKFKIIKIIIETNSKYLCTNVQNGFKYRIYNNMFQGKWNDILFEADLVNYIIFVKAADIGEAYLFVLNVPLAMLIIRDGKIILHCSCACDDKMVYGFSGGKGVGKSTVCSIFAYYNRQVFSDDTICIDAKNRRVFSNYMVEKYTVETIHALSNLHQSSMNCISLYNGKQIKKLEYVDGFRELNVLHINYLFRGSEFAKVRIANKNVKAELFKNNIVGYRYADKELQSLVEDSIKQILDHCDLNSSILYIPFFDLSNAKNLLHNLENLIFTNKLARR